MCTECCCSGRCRVAAVDGVFAVLDEEHASLGRVDCLSQHNTVGAALTGRIGLGELLRGDARRGVAIGVIHKRVEGLVHPLEEHHGGHRAVEGLWRGAGKEGRHCVRRSAGRPLAAVLLGGQAVATGRGYY